MSTLKGKKILLGISSGIAVYKLVEIVRLLKSLGVELKAVMTNNAEKLIKKGLFECETYTELFIRYSDYSNYKENPQLFTHITLAKFPDVIVIAPATANIIAKIANGIADDLLTTIIITTKVKVFICPAMNVNMYQNKIVQDNIRKLRKYGFEFIGPNFGELACGDIGKGRLAEPKEISERLSKFFEKKDSMRGLNILVTAGAFSEQIDPVRVLTNKSSGKMGIAIANESLFRGANVTLLRGNTTIEPNENIKDINVYSAEELLRELKKNKKQDIIIHCAAIPDFNVEKSRKKLSSNEEVMLRLKPAKKILDEIKKINKKVFLVGFKAEYNLNKEQLIKKAYQRLKKAKCDMIVANDIAKGVFSSDKNEVYIIDKNNRITYLPFSQKSLIAERILDEILTLHSFHFP